MPSHLSKPLQDCSIALVYDRVNTRYGGAEHVLSALHQVFPDAPLFTSVYDKDTAHWANTIDVRPSWLQKIPGAKKNHRLLAPLMPLAFESFDLSHFDIVISVTSAEAKGVITLPHQLHICYLLTPTRYLYSHKNVYLDASQRIGVVGARAATQLAQRYLRWWDQAASARPDVYIPISKLVASRAEKYYQQKTTEPIYPPVKPPTDTKNEATKDSFFLVVSRFVRYKKIDVAIQACEQAKRKLVIVGDGPDKKRLEELAQQVNSQQPGLITILPPQSAQKVSQLLSEAQGLIMVGLEDFGITALDAVAHLTPPIVHAKSGVSEVLQDKKTGLLLKDESVSGLIQALYQIEKNTFSASAMKKVIKTHQTSAFQKRFISVVATLWKDHYGK